MSTQEATQEAIQVTQEATQKTTQEATQVTQEATQEVEKIKEQFKSKLAEIAEITQVSRIANTDHLATLTFKDLGWIVISNITETKFKVGDLVVYFNIGSILDVNNKHSQFLEGKPLKTKKLRGIISQGLAITIDILKDYNVNIQDIKVGDDVTQLLQVQKHIEQEETHLYSNPNKIKSMPEKCDYFPSYLIKTDAPRIQSNVKHLRELKDQQVTITKKFDGTSGTFVCNKQEFFICSRNFKILEDHKNVEYFYILEKKYNIQANLLKLNRNIAIQAEIYGPKINSNRHQTKELNLAVFDIFDIDTQQYLNWDFVVEITKSLNLLTVDVVYNGKMKEEWLDCSKLLLLADEQIYSKNINAEGIVIKNNIYVNNSRITMKAISNKYLLKYNL
jgi:RNA ligase (TIGR02306 family)